MKKLLLMGCLLTTLSCLGQKITVTPMSLDPESPSFVMWRFTMLHMFSDKAETLTLKESFGKDYCNADHTTDDIYFVLNKDHYKIWIPEKKMCFVAWTTKEEEYDQVPRSFLKFIEVIRDYRMLQKPVAHNN